MALETVVYNSQDTFSYGFKDVYSSMVGPNNTNLGYEFFLQEEEEHKSLVGIFDNHIMDQTIHANLDYYYSPPPSALQSLTEQLGSSNSSPEVSCPPPPPPSAPLPLDQSFLHGSSLSLPGQVTDPIAEPPATEKGRRKRRRTRTSKNKEELENQRMTHITVERNRRKQMNEYLAVLRSLMPPSYVQRGDQASIIGGAINFVKELEQLLQSMEGHKVRTKVEDDHKEDIRNGGKLSSNPSQSSSSLPLPSSSSPSPPSSSSSSSSTSPSHFSSPFADFFSFPQYSTRANQYYLSNNSSGVASENGQMAAAADIEVTMIDCHANLKILSMKKPRQLLKMVAGLGALRLSVLHLNVTTVDQMVLYSFSVKVEEGCHLNTMDEIAASVNQMLHRIEEPGLMS
ncbi:transcription factor bHLH94-like [Humulus lupulus]|uniref:transcription factor bHLH94-like n=1 Tax=Humulus lupulus TaxID=3486 RepID=UPI002B40B71D|nr:transcription factor bHLH94-like [Humulus lupulus]